MDETHGIECLWGDLESHPQCPHGNPEICKH